MKKYFVCLSVTWAVITVLTIPAFSQNATQAPAKKNSVPAEEAAKPKELFVYGEVQAVNARTASMTVQYYDYDSDEEKTLEVALNKDSRLENVKSIDEIKKGDWVDITCIASLGKKIALNVIVEKEDLFEEEYAPDNMTDE